jgi:hypothetical protein
MLLLVVVVVVWLVGQGVVVLVVRGCSLVGVVVEWQASWVGQLVWLAGAWRVAVAEGGGAVAAWEA